MQPITKNEDLKKFLAGSAESGVIGSGIGVLKATVEKLKATDAPLAEELAKDIKRLEAAGDDADAVKGIAKEMMDKVK